MSEKGVTNMEREKISMIPKVLEQNWRYYYECMVFNIYRHRNTDRNVHKLYVHIFPSSAHKDDLGAVTHQ